MSTESRLGVQSWLSFRLRASHCTRGLDELLEEVLDAALADPHFSAGAAVVVDIGWGDVSRPVVGHRGEADGLVACLTDWLESVTGPAAGRRSGSDSRDARDLLAQRSASATVSGSLASAVFAEQRKVYGGMLLRTSGPGRVSDLERARLAALETEATWAIGRWSIRRHFAQQRLDLDLVGVSPALLEVESQARLAAAGPKVPVLLVGERGSGKEVIARAIHGWSGRRDGPFVPVLGPALTDSLALSELYGHERHAFTGAHRSREGKFRTAQGGTLFLDEVGELPKSVQAMLLRVIERGEIQPVGSDRPTTVDVRVIAATNRELREPNGDNGFRADLLDRLSVFRLDVPPLRERREDIRVLAAHFAHKYCHELHRFLGCRRRGCELCRHGARLACLSERFLRRLEAYPWPGNVRELANVVLRLFATVDAPRMLPDHLPSPIRSGEEWAVEPIDLAEDQTLETAIRRHIIQVLVLADGNQARAARLLGLPYSTLQSKMKKLGISLSGDADKSGGSRNLDRDTN